MQEKGLFSVKELSSYLGVSPCTVRRRVKSQDIPFIRRKGIGIRFKREDIDKWLESSSSRPLLETPLLEKCLKESLTPPSRGDRNPSGGTRAMAKAKSKARHNFGFGAIYQRKTKRGIVRWYLDYRDARGKRAQKLVVNASSPEEAYQALKCTVIREHNRSCGINGPDQDLTFRKFSEMYLNNYAKQNKISWKDDQYRLEANMSPYFGSYGLGEITPLTIEKYKARRLRDGVTKSTVNRELTILKKMFNLAIDWALTTQNPATKVKLFSEKDTQKERTLTYEEETRLLEESPNYLKPILITALNTGMRRGEILNLDWDQVDLEKGLVLVKKTKSGKNRLVPINGSFRSVLLPLRPRSGRNGFVFPNPATGKPYTEVKKSFKMACTKAGITGLRFHDLRHTFASRLVEAGADIVTVRDLLGHFSVKMTQRYTHPGQSHKVAAVELLDQKAVQNGENLLHPCYTN